MPPRSVKMKRFIFGFQRRVWWPKWTPASSNSFMETTGMRAPFSVSIAILRRASRESRRRTRGHRPRKGAPPGRRDVEPGNRSRSELVLIQHKVGGEVARELGAELQPLARDRMREGELGRVEELPPERRIGAAIDAVADHRQVDRGEMYADLVHPPRF